MRRHAMVIHRAQQRWIQAEYPTVLATRLVNHVKTFLVRDRERFMFLLAEMAKQNWFVFPPKLAVSVGAERHAVGARRGVSPFAWARSSLRPLQRRLSVFPRRGVAHGCGYAA